jgi:GT2 family glycosyltransferase
MSPPLVSVIVLTFNGKDYVDSCLSSILEQSYSNTEVIVVDNASSDRTVDLVEQQFPSVTLIRNSSNLGFAAGNNIGIRKANGSYIAVLNQDTKADSQWLEELVRVANSNDRIGTCAPKVLRMDEPTKIDSAGLLLFKDLAVVNRGLGETDVGQYECEEEVFGPYGAAALYRREMLDEIGLYDADYFLLHEEDDLAWRARFAQWKCIYVPASRVYHAHSATTGMYSPLKLYYGERNRIWVVAKFLPIPLICSSLLFTTQRYLGMVSFAVRGKGQKAEAARQHSLIRLGYTLAKAWAHGIWGLPKVVKKRRQIQRAKKVSAQEIKGWLKEYSATLKDVVER